MLLMGTFIMVIVFSWLIIEATHGISGKQVNMPVLLLVLTASFPLRVICSFEAIYSMTVIISIISARREAEFTLALKT